jgi:hypothetical protein
MPSSLDARRGSNLPNNGVRWPTGLKDTPTDRFRSARLQSPNRRMPCTQKCIWHDRVDLFAARLVFFPSRALPYMPSFLFICPRTGMYAQGWTDAHGPKNDSTYENTTCNACHRLHLINSKTGRMLGPRNNKLRKAIRAYDSFSDVSFDNGIIDSPSHLSVHDASSCICGPLSANRPAAPHALWSNTAATACAGIHSAWRRWSNQLKSSHHG